MFWLANFTWDMLLYIISVSLVFLLILIFKSTFENVDYGIFVVAASLFGCAMILLSYWLAFWMSSGRTAVLLVGCISPVRSERKCIVSNFLRFAKKVEAQKNRKKQRISPVLTFAAMILLSFFSEDWFESVNTALNFLPPYFLTSTLILAQLYTVIPEDDGMKRDLWAWSNLGIHLFLCSMFCLLMLLLIVLWELSLPQKLCDVMCSVRPMAEIMPG